jgi:hypothetical protein
MNELTSSRTAKMVTVDFSARRPEVIPMVRALVIQETKTVPHATTCSARAGNHPQTARAASSAVSSSQTTQKQSAFAFQASHTPASVENLTKSTRLPKSSSSRTTTPSATNAKPPVNVTIDLTNHGSVATRSPSTLVLLDFRFEDHRPFRRAHEVEARDRIGECVRLKWTM